MIKNRPFLAGMLASGAIFATLACADPNTGEEIVHDPNATSPATPVIQPEPTPEPLVGDDNGDGVIHEDESGWDCRWDGNTVCGVEIEGMWYLIDFEDGSPVSVRVRPEINY